MTPKDPPSFENQERTHSSPLSEDLAERPPPPFLYRLHERAPRFKTSRYRDLRRQRWRDTTILNDCARSGIANLSGYISPAIRRSKRGPVFPQKTPPFRSSKSRELIKKLKFAIPDRAQYSLRARLCFSTSLRDGAF